MAIKDGILPRKSSKVCILIAPFCVLNFAHGNSARAFLNNYEMIEDNRYFQVGEGKKLRIPFYYCVLQEYFFSTVGHQ